MHVSRTIAGAATLAAVATAVGGGLAAESRHPVEQPNGMFTRAGLIGLIGIAGGSAAMTIASRGRGAGAEAALLGASLVAFGSSAYIARGMSRPGP